MRAGLLVFFFLLSFGQALAEQPPSGQLEKCLKRADTYPDIGAAEAGAWIKKGGGNDAHLCRAFAQANRGMHEDAAREFWYLASAYDKKDAHRAADMHALSGSQFAAAKNIPDATAQFGLALREEPDNAGALLGRAKLLMQQERYWDAIADLNRIITRDSADAEALRQRGLAWLRLGDSKNAQEDFARAAEAGARK